MKSNAIVYARDGQTIGVGAGQMSRVDAAKFGAMKAVLPLANCVAASDAFFPFPDGLEAVAAAGATAVIQPGGSVRDQEVIEAANDWAWPWCLPGCGTSGISLRREKRGRRQNRAQIVRSLPLGVCELTQHFVLGYSAVPACRDSMITTHRKRRKEPAPPCPGEGK